MRGFALAESHCVCLIVPRLRREGEARQNSGRDEKNQGKNVYWERTHPIARPARIANAPLAGHYLPGEKNS